MTSIDYPQGAIGDGNEEPDGVDVRGDVCRAVHGLCSTTSWLTTALLFIRAHCYAGLEGLQWTVNAYTLTFAVLLLTGAALGERYGRRRMSWPGWACLPRDRPRRALAPSIGLLIAARAVQGVGAAVADTADVDAAFGGGFTRSDGARRSGSGARWAGSPSRSGRSSGRRRGGASWQWIFWLERADRMRCCRRQDPARGEPGIGEQADRLGVSVGPERSACSGSCSAWCAATPTPGHPRPWPWRPCCRRGAGGGFRRTGELRGAASRCCRCGSSADRGFALPTWHRC